MRKKILLVGDSCIDQFYYSNVTRRNPEAPSFIFRIDGLPKMNEGMASNVKANLESLSPEIEIDFLTQRQKIVKTRYVDRDSNYILFRVDDERPSCPFDVRDVIDTAEYDALVVSDYNKGFLNTLNMERLMDWFDGPIFMDTKKILGEWSRKAIVKINAKEFKENEIAWIAANQYSSAYPDDGKFRELLVTRGGEGIEWRGKLYPVEKVEVRDVVGAGDTALAGLVIGYLENNGDMVKAIEFANKAARVAVSHPGVVAVKRSEVI